MTDEDVRAASWAERFFHELPEHLRFFRAEALWRTMAPNGLDLMFPHAVADFGGTRGTLSMTTPDEWLVVAELIEGLLEREPVKNGPRWSGERIILGTFAAELRSYVGSAERTHEA
jgi:hypothetical protein